jgi:4-amino-4-deoxy-L-arabinose transferase-like glycosyltransferase
MLFDTVHEGHDPAAAPPVSAERWLAWVVLALILLALAIRVPLFVHGRLGEDETEHLHAAWAVAHDQVPYRDFWQIHPPLLYYLMAPVFALLGEDVKIIYVGRGLMLLCLLLCLVQLYRIARVCFDKLTGLLAVCLLSYLLLWWRPAYEVRPDLPQTLLILVSLWRFMRAWEDRSRAEFLASGALLGIASCFLLKTLLPLVGFILVFALSASLRRSATVLRETLSDLLCFLAAFSVPLILGGVLLWKAGAWPGFLQWVVVGAFRYPERFSPFLLMHPEVHFVFYGLALIGVGQTVTRFVRARIVDEVRLSPLLAGSVTAAAYLFLMPAPFAQSALPFLPVAAMYGAAMLRQVVAQVVSSKTGAPSDVAVAVVGSARRLGWATLMTVLLLGVCVPPVRALLAGMPRLSDQWADSRHMIRNVLALTSPEDSVFDAYSLYIFRPHASYYYRLNNGVLTWLRSGVIQDTEIIRDLQRSHCKVVIFSQRLTRLPPNVLGFLRSHYVPTVLQDEKHVVLVAGNVLHRDELVANRATVSLVASAQYAVRAGGGTPRVTIDGQLYHAPLFLTQGDHQLAIEGRFESLAIFYSRALTLPVQ